MAVKFTSLYALFALALFAPFSAYSASPFAMNTLSTQPSGYYYNVQMSDAEMEDAQENMYKYRAKKVKNKDKKSGVYDSLENRVDSLDAPVTTQEFQVDDVVTRAELNGNAPTDPALENAVQTSVDDKGLGALVKTPAREESNVLNVEIRENVGSENSNVVYFNNNKLVGFEVNDTKAEAMGITTDNNKTEIQNTQITIPAAEKVLTDLVKIKNVGVPETPPAGTQAPQNANQNALENAKGRPFQNSGIDNDPVVSPAVPVEPTPTPMPVVVPPAEFTNVSPVAPSDTVGQNPPTVDTVNSTPAGPDNISGSETNISENLAPAPEDVTPEETITSPSEMDSDITLSQPETVNSAETQNPALSDGFDTDVEPVNDVQTEQNVALDESDASGFTDIEPEQSPAPLIVDESIAPIETVNNPVSETSDPLAENTADSVTNDTQDPIATVENPGFAEETPPVASDETTEKLRENDNQNANPENEGNANLTNPDTGIVDETSASDTTDNTSGTSDSDNGTDNVTDENIENNIRIWCTSRRSQLAAIKGAGFVQANCGDY